MSFYTTLILYRPQPPPVVTGRNLAELIQKIRATGALAEKGFTGVDVKFGAAIDSDDRPTVWWEPVDARGTVSTSREIDWDISTPRDLSLEQLVGDLYSSEQAIYRAEVSLGSASANVMSAVARHDSPENQLDLCLDSWSVTLGPIEVHSLSHDDVFHVGWMSINLSGGGYLFPWTFQDLIEHAEGSDEIRRVCEECRVAWPVEPLTPPARIQKLRSRLADLWPYESTAKPWDWYWGLAETG